MTEAVEYIGLDVHKETVAVAVADGERGSEVRYVGTVPNEDDAIRKVVTRLIGSGAKLNVCYEAGPCGYPLQTHEMLFDAHQHAFRVLGGVPRRGIYDSEANRR